MISLSLIKQNVLISLTSEEMITTENSLVGKNVKKFLQKAFIGHLQSFIQLRGEQTPSQHDFLEK
jgi:hypothetical protein